MSSVKKNKKETHACIVERSRSNDCHHRKGEATPLRPLPPHTWGRFLQKYQAVQMGQEAKVTPSPMKKIIRNTFFVLIWLRHLGPWKGALNNSTLFAPNKVLFLLCLLNKPHKYFQWEIWLLVYVTLIKESSHRKTKTAPCNFFSAWPKEIAFTELSSQPFS